MSVLNKYLADSGICSRRKAVELIKEGRVTVNGKMVDDPSYRVKESDQVMAGSKFAKPEGKVYLLLNKPKDYITTVSDDQGRKTVVDLVKKASKARLYPVGRLDRATTGLLLLTNDGDFAQKMAHPRNGIKKVYVAVLDRPFKFESMQLIRKGVRLRDGLVKVDTISYMPDKRHATVKITIHSGKYRVIRRLFEHVGYKVKKLDRVQYANFTKRGLPVGFWRFLKRSEMETLG